MSESSSSELIIIDYCASTERLSANQVHEANFYDQVEDKRGTFAKYVPKYIAGKTTGPTKLQEKGVNAESHNRSQTCTSKNVSKPSISESIGLLEVNLFPESDRDITSRRSSNPSKSRTKVTSSKMDMDKKRETINNQVRYEESRQQLLIDQKQISNFHKYPKTTFSRGSGSRKANVISDTSMESFVVIVSSDAERDIESSIPAFNISKTNNKIIYNENELKKTESGKNKS